MRAEAPGDYREVYNPWTGGSQSSPPDLFNLMDTRRKARCTGKIKHPSRGKAEAAKRSLERLNPDERYEVYVCPFLWRGKSHYHVGHATAGNPKNKYRKTDA